MVARRPYKAYTRLVVSLGSNPGGSTKPLWCNWKHTCLVSRGSGFGSWRGLQLIMYIGGFMYTYKFKVTKVVDGDTVYGIADLGFNISVDLKLRLARIDAPEIRGKERPQGLLAKSEVEDLLKSLPNDITITTTGKGKYGRWIAEIYINGVNLSDHLVENGLAEYVDY